MNTNCNNNTLAEEATMDDKIHRKLATMEKIIRVYPHPNADKLELVQVMGYQCVVFKDKYKAGDLIVFVKPDNVLPLDAWADSYRKYADKRIRAMKLRNEWSEGLIIDPEIVKDLISGATEGDDVTISLGITHYEAPVVRNNGDIKGTIGLPYGIPLTDEYRFESIKPEKKERYYGELVDVTLKVDGQSWSAFYHLETDKFGLLGRRMTLDMTAKNNYTIHLDKYDLENKLKEYCKKHQVSLCIRGESYGKGVQEFTNNPHARMPNDIAIFSVFMIDKNRYAGKDEQFYFVNVCQDLGLPAVPIIETNVPVTDDLVKKYATGITKINGKPFEGVVMKGKNFSFKVINKDYDSKK